MSLSGPINVDAPPDRVMNSFFHDGSPQTLAQEGGSDPMAGWEDDWQRGDLLGDYELVAKIGEGGMSRVYEGRHVSLGARVAIKTLKPEQRANPTTRARFEQEGRAMARVEHPNVVKVITLGAHRGAPYLVMEFLTGRDLGSRIDERGPMAVPEALATLLPVLSAVQEAHDQGLIHRDLKPDNIVLEETKGGRVRPVVVDFGIARVADGAPGGALTGTAAMLGTPGYMAPEQIRSARDVTDRADQYALGSIVYECLAGCPAFSGESIYEVFNRVAAGECPRLRDLRPDVPERLEQVVAWAMAVDPAGRFASVQDFALALLPFADDLTRAQWSSSFMAPRVRAPSERAPVPAAVAQVAAPPAGPPRRATTLREAASEIDAKPPAPPVRPSSAAWVGAVTAVVLIAALVVVFAGGGAPKPSRFIADVSVVPAGAVITVDGRPVARGRYRSEFADGQPHRLRFEAEGHVGAEVTFINAPPPGVIVLERRVPPTAVVQVLRPQAAVVAPPSASRAGADDAPSRRSTPQASRRGAGSHVPTRAAPPVLVSAPARPRDPCVGPHGEPLCL